MVEMAQIYEKSVGLKICLELLLDFIGLDLLNSPCEFALPADLKCL